MVRSLASGPGVPGAGSFLLKIAGVPSDLAECVDGCSEFGRF